MRGAGAGAVSAADQWLQEFLTENDIRCQSYELASYKRMLIAQLIAYNNTGYRKQCEAMKTAFLSCPRELDPFFDMLFIAMVFGVDDPLAKKKNSKSTYRFSVKLGAYPEQDDAVDYRGKHSIHIQVSGGMGGEAMMHALLQGATRWSNELLYHNEQKPYRLSDARSKALWGMILVCAKADVMISKAHMDHHHGAAVADEMLETLSQEHLLLGRLLAMRAGKPQHFVFTSYDSGLDRVYGDMCDWVLAQSVRVTERIEAAKTALGGRAAELVLVPLFEAMGRNVLAFETFKLELELGGLTLSPTDRYRLPACKSVRTGLAAVIADERAVLLAEYAAHDTAEVLALAEDLVPLQRGFI